MTINYPTINRVRRWAALFVAGLAAAAVAAVAPVAVGPAAAAVPGLVAVEATLVSSAATVQSVTATCPAGTELISAGGYITGGYGNVTLDDIYPDEATNSVTVTGIVTDTYVGGSWRPTALASCATALPGFEWIHEQSPNNSSNKSVTATCPGEKTLVGIGATIQGGSGEVLFSGIVPKVDALTAPAANSVTVIGVEESTYTGQWHLHAFAGCADALTGQELVTSATGHDSTDPKTDTAACPGVKVATGGGAAIISGPAAIGNVTLDDAMFPNNVGSGTAPTAITGYAFVEDSPPGDPWTLVTYSLCANP